jgi:hypothetical protein
MRIEAPRIVRIQRERTRVHGPNAAALRHQFFPPFIMLAGVNNGSIQHICLPMALAGYLARQVGSG